MSPTAILVAVQCAPPRFHALAFRNAGVNVAEASSGADIKRLIAIQRPDAVLLEAGITSAASKDVWRALDQSAPAPRVVVFGDFHEDGVRSDAREHSAVCVAPQSEEDLVAAVQELMKRYQAARKQTERLHHELADNVRDFQMNFRGSVEAANPLEPSQGIVILVAEDEECVRRFLTLTLERSGYIVLEAVDGAEAVRALWNYSAAVRLVVLDWAMPGLSGLEIVRTMRQVSPEARVLICSGSPESIIRSALQGEIIEGVLEKPFLAVDLLEEVQRQMHLAKPPNSSRTRHAGPRRF